MTYFEMTEEQVQQSVAAARIDSDVSVAITQADRMAESGGCHMTVVRTKRHGVCIFNEYKMLVAKDEIIEAIYSTDNGFIFRSAA
ncbi:hypothetical protein [Microbulbifer sp. THAF38]|uniref:hypothetical protein n=1 Tax=Microbulbifer sp. THAF38 TaxID=2587856 RepID=UPI0012692793|nr:hypothetical protein [Microbulbifer sp. THAF38]QFT57102.1 hypothetical protein FIU95_21355 [Microbulbifer sp. THAF38]